MRENIWPAPRGRSRPRRFRYESGLTRSNPPPGFTVRGAARTTPVRFYPDCQPPLNSALDSQSWLLPRTGRPLPRRNVVHMAHFVSQHGYAERISVAHLALALSLVDPRQHFFRGHNKV